MNDSTIHFSNRVNVGDAPTKWISRLTRYRGAVARRVWFASVLTFAFVFTLLSQHISANPSNLVQIDTSIAYDECVNGTIGVPGEEDNFTFTGWAGDHVTAYVDNHGPGSLSLRLMHGDTELAYTSPGPDRELSATLPTNDTYTLIVEGYENDLPAYTLCLNHLDVDAILSYDQCLSDSITIVGAQDYFTFTGEAGDRVTAFVNDPEPGSITLRLMKGDIELGKSGPGPGNQEVRETLTANDTYTLIVDGYQDDLPGYTLCLNHLDVDATLSYDQCLSDSITIMGAQDYFTFTGEAGDRVTAFVNDPEPGSITLRLMKGDIELGKSGPGPGNQEVRETLTANDTYTLIVDGYQDDLPGYTLCLNIVDVDSWISSYGQCISDSITVMGAQDSYSFNGWAGYQVMALLDNHGPGSLTLRLMQEDNELDKSGPGAGNHEVGAVLPTDGIYTVVVDGYQDDLPGYTLCLPIPTGISGSRFWELTLYQNHPNPFNPSTTISFTLPRRVIASLKIYNVEGKLLRTLVDEVLDEGYKEYLWNGRDDQGISVSSGIYFYRLKAGDKVLTRKMMLIK